MSQDRQAYVVQEEDGKYLVVNDTGRTVMSCNDQRSAAHYADLMNSAFRSGYRAALRDRRKKPQPAD